MDGDLKMITFTDEQKARIDADYKIAEELAAGRRYDICNDLGRCINETEEYCFKFLVAYLPMTDLTNWSGELFYNHVHTCLENLALVPWADGIDTETFLNFVLMMRVNNENLEHYNAIIFNEVWPRIKDLSMGDAALEVNLWCFEKATYSSTDMRTVSPLTMMRNTNGRCGEESTFLTSALRACCIPARQCYTPRWAASESNHAWVEVLVDGKWCYIGACEPDAFLNSGWFRMPASRAMLTNTRVFSGFLPKNSRFVQTTTKIKELNTLDIYAKTRDITCTVVENGAPKKDVRVEMALINFGSLYDFSDSLTDEAGKVYFTTGYGDLFITATMDDKVLYGKIDVRETDNVTLDWANATYFDGLPAEFDFDLIPPAPSELADLERPANAEEIVKAFQVRQKAAEQIRINYKNTFFNENSDHELLHKYPEYAADIKQFLIDAQGNSEKIIAFIDDPKNIADKCAFLKTLSRKDFGDCDNIILEKHFAHQMKYAEAFADNRLTFERHLLAIRIANEWLSDYTAAIEAFFSDEQKKAFIDNPATVHTYVENEISVSVTCDYDTLVALPYNLLLTKRGSQFSKAVLETAICRSLGIPARTSYTGEVEYWKDGEWFSMRGVALSAERSATLVPTFVGTEEAYKNAHLERYENGVFTPVPMFRRRRTETEQLPDEGIALVPGNYRLMTNFRIKNGGIQAKMYHFSLKAGDKYVAEFEVRGTEPVSKDEAKTVYDAAVLDKEGKEYKLSSLVKEDVTVFAWLGVREEPTEHLFNEMLSVTDAYKPFASNIYFMIKEDGDLTHVTLKKLLDRLPEINIMYFKNIPDEVYASLGTKDKRLPLAIAVNKELKVSVISTGYNIGSAEQLLKALENK
ncbi:MAG: transglutaminase domain-containing protein [Ruminococcaceae bacterium]|nr:transglutaminase domain-containing protein [Oscillospiraceae bacterium]